MTKQNDKRDTMPLDGRNLRAGEPSTPETVAVRKEFVEPAVSTPVDVLEATTFFQGTDSGGTGSPE